MFNKIDEIQNRLKLSCLDGWLLYDHHGSNKFLKELLHISPTALLTRRFFYWIPKEGEPVSLVHHIEEKCLELPGKKLIYLSRNQLDKQLSSLLMGYKRIAMEYSPKNGNPYVSVVDAGTIEWIKEKGVEIVSSDDLLQRFTSVLDEDQIHSHLAAAKVLEKTIARTWEMIGERLRKGKKVTEYDVQQYILSEFLAEDCVSGEGGPICAVGPHSALPHYTPLKESAKAIEKGDFILIDLWCKKDIPHGVYADITRVGVIGREPTSREQELFSIVRKAQVAGTEFIISSFEQKKEVRGFEVDDVCRKVIEGAGFGDYFTHRSGHSIDTSLHGGGAHLDHFETLDERKLLPGTCFSLEPAIYLPEEFGVRLEYDILIKPNGAAEVTGGAQNKIERI